METESNGAAGDGLAGKEASPPGFQPYIPTGAKLAELTPTPVLVGTVLGIVFGASSLYLVLKVGLTVSASIPVAVIAITLFKLAARLGFRETTILENNIVQTAGSAGESIAFGLGVTMPAIMILGFDLELSRVMWVATLGGLLGVLMMIPLRRALIVAQHGALKYPEGTACAEVLKAGASAESKAKASTAALKEAAAVRSIGAVTETNPFIIFIGFAIGLLYKAMMVMFRLWKEIPEKVFGAPFKGGSVSAEISPELLGVGYIIGPRIASIMCAGGVLSYLVLIPAIKFFGEKISGNLPPGTMPIAEMGPDDVRNAYVLYIGAGAVAAGGIISVLRSLPIIWHGLRGGLRDFRALRGNGETRARTERDLPMGFLLAGIALLVAAIMFARPLQMNLLGAVLIVVFGFLFVTVSSRLTGEIGSSSNPISGMTVATLLLTCLIFLILKWTGSNYYVTALSVGGVVCIAASNGGTTSQDLKTGFLVGATPRSQQVALLIGALASALALGPILLRLNEAGTVYVKPVTFKKLDRPAPVGQQRGLAPYTGTPPPGAATESWQLLALAEAEAASLNLKPGDFLVNREGRAVWQVRNNFSTAPRVNPATLAQRERLQGPQAAADGKEYLVWHDPDGRAGLPGKYLLDDRGQPVYLVDPGINGAFRDRPDGSRVDKFTAPKATLMSYIIKGILSRQLPWGLVLLGVMIAVVLEMSFLPSLAFAVGVYLPLSSSTPIFMGGFVRWLVDLYLRKKYRRANLTETQLAAEGDKSPGVLLASGYIAGGAMVGILVALLTRLAVAGAGGLRGALAAFNSSVAASASRNPYCEGPWADWLSLAPFLLLVVMLYLTGRDLLFRPKEQPTSG